MSLVHEGDLDIHGDQTVTQRVTGRITVHRGSSLVLMGTAEGGVIVRGGAYARVAGTTHGLFVAAGGHLVLTGTCVGSATNDGGDLIIEGVVTGDLIEYAGDTRLAVAAVHPSSVTPHSAHLRFYGGHLSDAEPAVQAKA